MTYPDGEVVDYTYNRAGNLQSMQGKKESHTYDYIKQLSYDEFEQRKYLKYGNDTETNYTYDATMRRLQQLQVKSGSRQVMNNTYSYDLVGNVLGIKNTAPIVNNTLGGTSNHEYQYDDFYRLKSAKATYQGEFTKASYELNMSYNKMHNITKKDLVHTVNNEQKGYVLNYNYDNELHPNAPSKISPPTPEGGASSTYTYDGNGNPTYIEQTPPSGGGGRKMTWDEENRLMGINDSGRIHQFTYDANGERVIKSSGDSQNVAINGETAATIVHTDDYTGYVSPYFVISKGKFTKHYFEGAGRIVSKLGNGAFAQPLKLTAGGVNYSKLTAEQQKALDTYVRSLGLPPGPPTQQGIYATPEFTGDPYPSQVIKAVEENQEPPEGWPRNPIFNEAGDVPGPPVQFGPPVEPTTVQAGEGFTGIGLPENDIFYFHPDHLGSTSYITTRNGSISQHVEYIAFGEVLFEEHSSSYSSPYLFNGKELDRETNLSYYGARYLDMKTSLWLNVDPLAEKFFNQSPYNYALNNPIRFVDPTGMGSEDSGDPPKKGNVRIVLNLGVGADIDDAAQTRVNQIKKNNPNDKLIYIDDDNLGNLKNNIETQIKEAKKQGYGKTLELSVFSHNGKDGPKGYYDPNNAMDLSRETGSEFEKGQMSPENWGNIDYNFNPKNSIAAFYGCSSITWAEKFLSITNVKHTAGNTGTAGGFYILICFNNYDLLYLLNNFNIMSYQVNLTEGELFDLKRIKREVKDSKILRRYQCLHMLHTGMKRQDVAELLDVYIDTITDWVKIYQSVGLVALGDLKYAGRRPSALDEHKETIKAYIESTSVNTVSQLQDYIKTDLNLEIEHSWLSRYLKKNSVALIKKQD